MSIFGLNNAINHYNDNYSDTPTQHTREESDIDKHYVEADTQEQYQDYNVSKNGSNFTTFTYTSPYVTFSMATGTSNKHNQSGEVFCTNALRQKQPYYASFPMIISH